MYWKLQFLCQTFNIFIFFSFIDLNFFSSHPSSSLYFPWDSWIKGIFTLKSLPSEVKLTSYLKFLDRLWRLLFGDSKHRSKTGKVKRHTEEPGRSLFPEILSFSVLRWIFFSEHLPLPNPQPLTGSCPQNQPQSVLPMWPLVLKEDTAQFLVVQHTRTVGGSVCLPPPALL